MFSNLPGWVSVVLILSQISYNMVYLEWSFSYVDSVLPSFKERFFPYYLLNSFSIILLCLYFRDTSYPLSFVPLSSLDDIYYLAIILM